MIHHASIKRALAIPLGIVLMAGSPVVVSHAEEVDPLQLARDLIASKRFEEVPLAVGPLADSDDPYQASQALLLLGRAKYETGEYSLALACFRKVYDHPTTETNLARARLGAGWSLWKLERHGEIAAEIAPLKDQAAAGCEFDYLLGMASYSMHDWPAAIDRLKLVSDVPSVHAAPAIFYLGECYLNSTRHQEARSSFRRLLDTYPESDWADDALWGLVRTARLARLQLEFDAAVDELKEKFPNSQYIGQIPYIEGETASLKQEADPDFELFEEAVGLERDGHFDAALSAYHDLLISKETHDLRIQVLWRAARLHQRRKQYSEATQLYQELLADYPNYDKQPEVHFGLARIAESIGKPSQAAKYYRLILDRFPESEQAPEAAYWLALTAADEKKSDEARKYVDWLSNRISRDQAHHGLWRHTLCLECQLLAADNQWKQIRELLEANPCQGDADAVEARLLFWQAEATLRLGHVDDAQEHFENLQVKTVGIHEAWVPMVMLRRAQLAAHKEDWSEVLRLVRELDECHPEFELAYECDYLRGRALAGRGEMSAARAAYREVLENEWAANTETAAMAQWMIGETYFHQRSYGLAKDAYQKVIERHDIPEWQARAALQAGKCAELSDDWSEAVNLYSDALKRWHGSNSTAELNARLQWVQKHLAQREAVLRR